MKAFTRSSLLFFLFFFVAHVAHAVTSSFTADATSGCAPLVVNFTNTSSGGTTYSWDFGNGVISPVKDGATTYTAPGTYTVTLTTTSGGVSVKSTMTIIVYPNPKVSFTAVDTSVCPGQSVTFNSTTVGGVPGPVTCNWAFGDGSGGSGSPTSHVYSSPGFYNVTLTATNAMGCVSSLTQMKFVHILNPPAISFSVPSTTFCKAPGHAVFTDFTTGVPTFKYSWSFGDGGSSSSPSPIHDYAVGTYDVHLTVTDGNGCTDSVTKYAYITVKTIKADFSYPAKACVGTTVTFVNTSSPHTSSRWDYGDGGTDFTDPGHHAFAVGVYNVRLVVSDGGCSDTVYHTITIIPGPTINFTMSPTQPCPPPVGITFTGTAPTGSTVKWAYSDGGIGGGITTTHTFATKGIDTITMTATDPATGCTASLTKYDTLYDLAMKVVDTPAMGCVPLTVKFGVTPVTSVPHPQPYPYGIVSYTWGYGDGSPIVLGSTGATHVYTATGVYRAWVKITTGNGCVVTDTCTVKVGKEPVITVTALNPHVCFGQPIHYVIKIVDGPIDGLHWQFDDFYPDEGEKYDTLLTYDYIDKKPGTFDVKVRPAYNGCEGFDAHVTVTVDSPMAVLSWKKSCSPARTVTLYDESFGDDYHIWVFGDGSTSTLGTVTHVYALPIIYAGYLATYNVRSGCHDTTSFGFDFTRPATKINYNPYVCKDIADTFTAVALGSTKPTYSWSSPNSHFWYLGTTSVSSTDKAIDTFRVAGVQHITLAIKYADGCGDTMMFDVNVGHPIVSFTATPTTGCAPLSTVFTDASVDSPGFTISKYAWAFGDGSSNTVTSPTIPHVFATGGAFNTKLIAIDNHGCMDSATLNVATAWKPKADFTSLYRMPCAGDNIQFLDASTGSPVSYSWSFGDGGTSTLASPFHTYTVGGSYNVSLTVTDAHGCTDMVTYPSFLTVVQPTVSFYMTDSFSICPPLSTNFVNTSVGATSFAWDLGDGTLTSMMSPSDIYITTGVYTVTLTGTDAHGCKGTAIGHAIIYGYAGGFTYTPIRGCSPLDVHFKAAISNVPSIIWDFSDGTISKAAMTDTAEHIYTLPGSYLPKLILSDNTGCQNSSIGVDTIKVDLVTPGYRTNPNPVCEGGAVSFTDTSTSFFSAITTEIWTMPDGSTETGSPVSWTYAKAGTFPLTFVVTDGWGCTGTLNDNIIVHPLPSVQAGPDTVICVSDKATLIATGAKTYSWTPVESLSCGTCNPTKASPTVATQYAVIGTDEYGCFNFDTILVGLKTKTVSHATGDTEVCRNVPVVLRDSGGTSYVWMPATGLDNATSAAPISMPPSTQRYTVIAYLGSCIPDTAVVWVTVHQLPTVNAGPNQRLLEGSIAQLDATGTLIYKYAWNPDPTLTCDTCLSTTATMSMTTTYVINVASDFGCKASDTVLVQLYCDKTQLFVPNTFTPNGDGQNDVLYPRGIGVSVVNSFRIYNRWGELMFERANIKLNDASNAWDGSFAGNPPKPDVYVYVLNATCETGEALDIKGDVTIIR